MKKALLIGINNYPNGYELRGCIEDVRSIAPLLERNEDGSKNFDVQIKEDIQTSREAMSMIQTLFSGNDDYALLYFSGHGYLDEFGGTIVMPEDIRTDGHYYVGLQMKDIMTLVNQSHIKNKIVILDCCHSGFLGKEHVNSCDSVIGSGVSILTACREDESAMELGGHGMFTELLSTALSGGAADFLGNITIGGIYAYIDRSFGAWEQRPVFKTNVTEFAPLRCVKPPIDINIIRQLTALFPDKDQEMQLNPSFEDTNDPCVEHEYVEPYADSTHVAEFKMLQKLQSIGFVKPVGEEFMYFAAMHNKSCKLTPLGQYYWRLVNENHI